MKTAPFGIAGLAVLAGALFGFCSSLRAQEDEPRPIVLRAISATVDYGNDAIFNPAKSSTDFEPLGLLPQQLLAYNPRSASLISSSSPTAPSRAPSANTRCNRTES